MHYGYFVVICINLETKKTQTPNQNLNYAQFVIDIISSRPDKVAFIDDPRQITYAELTSNIRRFTGALSSLNIQQEQLSRHPVFSKNWVQFTK